LQELLRFLAHPDNVLKQHQFLLSKLSHFLRLLSLLNCKLSIIVLLSLSFLC
jgi:hypothetical protein